MPSSKKVGVTFDNDDDGDEEYEVESEEEEKDEKTKLSAEPSRRSSFRKTMSSLHMFHPVREVKGNPEIDVLCTMTYIMILLAYTAVSIVSYIYRERIEDWQLMPAGRREVPRVRLHLEAECTTNWGCTSFWNSSRAEWPQIDERYVSQRAAEKCQRNQTVIVRSTKSIVQVDVELCYSALYDDGVNIVIPFDSDYGDDIAYHFEITSPDSSLFLDLPVEPGQRKTAFFSQNLKSRRKRTSSSRAVIADAFGIGEVRTGIDSDSAEPYAADLFYDGKNVNATALLRLRASQFVNVASVGRDGAVLDVFAQVGGFHAIIWTIVVYVRGIILRSGHTATHGFLDCLREMN